MKTLLISILTLASICAEETETIRLLKIKQLFVTKTAEYKVNSFMDMGGDRYLIRTDEGQVILNKSEILEIKEIIDEKEKVVPKRPHSPQEGISEERKKLVRDAQYYIRMAKAQYDIAMKPQEKNKQKHLKDRKSVV